MALVLACHRLCSRHGKAASGRLALSSRVELEGSLILSTSSNLQLLVLLSLTTLRLRRQFEYCQANLSLRLLSSFVFDFAFVCSLPLAFGCTLVACGRPHVTIEVVASRLDCPLAVSLWSIETLANSLVLASVS